MKKKTKRLILLSIFLFIISPIIGYVALLDNDVEVEPESDLTYYLDIYYDGKDVRGTSSSDSVVANVSSGYINVEDKLPEGLTFLGFTTSEDGTIGAVKRSDGSSCPGYVLDDTNEQKTDSVTCDNAGNCYYHGLHYTKSDNTVRFKVKDLQAGCKLTVGIKTKTPTVDDPSTTEIETRRDFYNSAVANEGILTVMSNMVHVFMGSSSNTHTVKYQYEGNVPSNVPTLPSTMTYASGTKVSVIPDINIEGYNFSGWSSSDVEITNGKFTMPDNDVVIKGSFTEKSKYKVTYVIEGEVPEKYNVPSEKQYYSGASVTIDSMLPDDEFKNYKFLGWNSNDIEITNGLFTMPDKDVVIKGKFELLKYKVIYKFHDGVLPPNSNNYLPATKEYEPGTKVKLEKVNSVDEYVFMGWYKEDNFDMPKEDITIYGEWKIQVGKFSPKISQIIVDEKKSYKNKDKIVFKITVENTSSYPLTNATLVEKLDGCSFISGDGYTVKDSKNVVISKIPANGSINVYASYTAGGNIYKVFTNIVELTSATGKNNTVLDDSRDYVSKKDFLVANPVTITPTSTLKIIKVDENNKEIDGSKFTLYYDENLEDKIGEGLEFDKLKPDTTYYLKETTVPSGYEGLDKVLKVEVDSNRIITIEGYTVTNKEYVGTVRITNTSKEEIIPNPKTDDPIPEPEPEPEKPVEKPEEKKIDLGRIIGFTIPPVGITFIFLFLIFKKKKRTIMLYMPGVDIKEALTYLNNIDYETINSEKAKVVVLAGGNIVENNYIGTNIYNLTKDGYELIRKQPESMNEKELLRDYIDFAHDKYKASKYDLLFINSDKITIDYISNSIGKSVFNKKKLEVVLFRNNIDNATIQEINKYTDTIGILNTDSSYDIEQFIKNINYINNKDKGLNIANKYRDNNINYVVISK